MAHRPPPTWRTRDCSLSGLDPSTNSAWLDLPGTGVPAGTALRVIETPKPHHHYKVTEVRKANIDITIKLILMLTLALMLVSGPFTVDMSDVMIPLILMLMSLVKTRLWSLFFYYRLPKRTHQNAMCVFIEAYILLSVRYKSRDNYRIS